MCDAPASVVMSSCSDYTCLCRRARSTLQWRAFSARSCTALLLLTFSLLEVDA
jgi:hypothetical protein